MHDVFILFFDLSVFQMGQEANLIPKSPNYVNPFLATADEEKVSLI